MRLLLLHLLMHAEPKQRLLQFGVIRGVAVLLQIEKQVGGAFLGEGNGVFQFFLKQEKLLGVLHLERRVGLVGMRFFVVETEPRGTFLLELDLRSHLSRAHCKFRYVLQLLTGRDLTARSLHLATLPEVVNYLERDGFFSFCLHAFEQIILIAILEDHSTRQYKTQMLET